jgi:phosphoglucomutase
MATLPAWSTTSVFEDRAMFKIKSPDHAALKAAYRSVFLREWEKRKATLHERFCIESWRALATNGTSEKDVSPDFAQAGKGGLRIVFSGSGGDVAFLWMRGSGTEPVLRIMADIDGGDREDEAYLLDWQTQMVKEADKG